MNERRKNKIAAASTTKVIRFDECESIFGEIANHTTLPWVESHNLLA
jgi:hypothetical protein